jgi:hypothetical protein
MVNLMAMEIREVRTQWQNCRQELLRADYNHADEALARALYFADNTPIVKSVLMQLRQSQIYKDFDPDKWLNGRSNAGCSGCGQTTLGFSLDEKERAAQSLSVLESARDRFAKGGDGLWKIGITTYGGGSSKLVDSVRSAIDVIFNPFYAFLDKELRTLETLITPVDIMNQIQSLVDSEASMHFPETHKLLVNAYGQLFNLSAKSGGTSWNEIGYKCRDIIIAFSKEVFDPSFVPDGQEMPKEDDAGNKLKWTARRYLKEEDVGDRYRESVEKIIESNLRFVNVLGHRKNTANEFDARLGVIYTYLTIWIMNNIIAA